jgi:DNA-binding transcriptional regulator YdaS (Cro superfamily)
MGSTGMGLIRARRGLMAEIARVLGLTKGAVWKWRVVPAERVLAIERISGIPRQQLRPDLYPDEADR